MIKNVEQCHCMYARQFKICNSENHNFPYINASTVHRGEFPVTCVTS